MILFIIGNGFDRNLKLPTDYRNDLRRILKKNDIDRFNIIDNLYFNNNEFLWSQFENKIGNIQEKAINDISESIDDDYQRFLMIMRIPFLTLIHYLINILIQTMRFMEQRLKNLNLVWALIIYGTT